MIFSLSFVFFQAEDGIRDLTVTGVQTCALPILARAGECAEQREDVAPQGAGREARVAHTDETRPDHGECDTPGFGARRMLAQPGRRDAPGEDGLERHERSEEHTSELQSQSNLVCRLLLEKKKNIRED